MYISSYTDPSFCAKSGEPNTAVYAIESHSMFHSTVQWWNNVSTTSYMYKKNCFRCRSHSHHHQRLGHTIDTILPYSIYGHTATVYLKFTEHIRIVGTIPSVKGNKLVTPDPHRCAKHTHMPNELLLWKYSILDETLHISNSLQKLYIVTSNCVMVFIHTRWQWIPTIISRPLENSIQVAYSEKFLLYLVVCLAIHNQINCQ